MPISAGARQLVKRTLSVARLKLLYERITLTRFTALYFVCTILACVVLSSLHIVSLVHDSEAVFNLSSVVEQSNTTDGIAILEGKTIELCSNLPKERGTVCMEVITFEGSFDQELVQRDTLTLKGTYDDDRDWSTPSDSSTSANASTITASPLGSQNGTFSSFVFSSGGPEELTNACVISLKWLNDVLHDAQREDVVIFLFQVWLFILSFVAILNESIPHLGTTLLGHLLSTGWAGYRVYSTRGLMNFYRNQITPQACSGHDFMGDWWENRIGDALLLVALNGATLLVMLYLSFKLFKVYAKQTFERVGASPKIYQIYKLVLIFSVLLQLSGFITLASTAMWIDKVVHGSLADLAKHAKVYLAAFVLTLVLKLPWLVLGWICVRRECHIRFTVFCLISAFLLAISIAMFYSELYRHIFSCWAFFATITITAFVLLVVTTFLGMVSRLNFGHGFARYIKVNQSLEGVNFTPVYFPRQPEGDVEKSMSGVFDVQLPDLPLLATPHNLKYPVPLHATQQNVARAHSTYSDLNAVPVVISASPLTSGLAPSPKMPGFLNTLKRLSASPVNFSMQPTRREQPKLLPNTSSIDSERGRISDHGAKGSLEFSRTPSLPQPFTVHASVSSEAPAVTEKEGVRPYSAKRNPKMIGLPSNPRSRLTRF
ncbi:hypothetical protein GALMADRAFT_156270 [Galerina marginata CBS 339.88]|uniref:Uncharacterized protein n=1 Tax=Galerina marginata (strain CBS 339.88) TaxID=685588 RepID=A0A067T1D7_GALM3|nr:hypothetical protein GALMADRAFT_156270 [Galerina marginata CBS 339.88]